ncbi:sigma-70 family RNA polymerase sigma factor [Acinetobacter qingfengensis]|uniref:Sigma-70 family RNA polymerase sigma factor n=1 Tax=Acinetobacter qingfengensis TaxID=1262585 RepID=A0A1E7REI8_9GAMM|nr:sigma-70 family RNA polymerase sigma factor [Acinetobacter qingfengensis]OEY97575.1 hypothetical protein BJI46_09260 [Acinetobacter qingfengensis]
MDSLTQQAGKRFCQIYAENYNWLSQWLYRHLKSNIHLEDIVQDTFLKLFISNQAHLIREPRAYLATTARCIVVDQARHAIVEKKYLEHLQYLQQENVQSSPEQTIMIVELLQRITLAVSDLAERPRLCLLLYYLDGMSQEKIAQHLKVSRRTVQLDLVKAMVHCHQWMMQN